MNARQSMAVVLGLGLCFVAASCGSSQQVPCAAPIVADYTAKMIAAGCIGEHFGDAKCETIKAQRDADEKAAGCK